MLFGDNYFQPTVVGCQKQLIDFSLILRIITPWEKEGGKHPPSLFTEDEKIF